MRDPLVSIVVPLYNKEEWISRTLSTVYNQTYSNWECLIINDGSIDRSLEIVNEFIKDHPGNWRIISQANLGQTHARNLGIDEASGEFIAFLDADDLWLPRKIELHMEAHLLNPDLGLSLTSYVIFTEGQKKYFRLVSSGNSKKMINNWFNMTGFGGLIESTGFLKKEILEKFGKYSESFSMTAGLDLSLKIISELQVVILKEPLVLYRLSPGQFHKNEDVLVRDLVLMNEKHARITGNHEHLQRLHASYLYWSNCRIRGTRYFVVTSLKNILLFRWRHIPMLYCLLSRNAIALVRGFLQRKLIREFLDKFSL